MKKLMSLWLVMAFVFSVVNVSYAKSSVVVEEDEPLLKEALSFYKIQREKEFLDTNVKPAEVSANGREKFIEEWKEELKIHVVNTKIDCDIKDILLNTASNIKIWIYEWVQIDYVCDGYDKVEQMGFGTDHILEFNKNNGKIQLISDSYQEITGYEVGTANDLKVLQERGSIEPINIENYEWTKEVVVPMATYSASAAISYSNKWCGNSNAGTSVSMNPSKYNPAYYYYPGADCCNFVSQCLKAGGMSTSGTWTVTLNTSGNPTADSSYTKSGEAWRYVPSFVNYWRGKGYATPRITNSNQAVAGNPIYYLKSDGYSSNHIMLIVGKNSAGQVLVNGHNNDAYRYPLTLSSKIYYTLDLNHSFGTVIARTATTHTLQCRNCSKTQTSAHLFASASSVDFEDATGTIARYTQICTICGYKK